MESDFWIALGIWMLCLCWLVGAIENAEDYPYDDDSF